MGLGGRKTKQRIGADPRNLSWSDDSSKFGAKYLQSLGWTSGTGLGVSGEGRTSNLKIHQKLDLMGIGANRSGRDGDDAGWRAGREFEGLLARLNQAQSSDTQDISMDEENGSDINNSAIDDSKKESECATRNEGVLGHPPEPSVNRKEGKTRRKGETEHKKKRKRSVTEDGDEDAKEAKRRRKEEKRERKEQRKAEKAAKKLMIDDKSESGPSVQVEVASVDDLKRHAQNTEAVKVAPRYRAHRARNIASKRLAAVSASGMNEILGISSSTCGPKTETSAVSFKTLSPKHSTKGDGDQTSAPVVEFTASTDHSKQATANDRDIMSTKGLGSYSVSSGGLGFRSAKEKAVIATQENDPGNDQLRKSGKSVAEYFAEKMRMKSTVKNAPGFKDAENAQ